MTIGRKPNMKVAPREIRKRKESPGNSFGYKPHVIWDKRER